MKLILLVIFVIIILSLAIYYFKRKGESHEQTQAELTHKEYLDKKLLELLTKNYPEINFTLKDEQITSNNGLRIETQLVNHRKYESRESFQINLYTSYPGYFETPIEERLVGLGNNDTSALEAGAQSFLAGQFVVIAVCMDFNIRRRMILISLTAQAKVTGMQLLEIFNCKASYQKITTQQFMRKAIVI